MDEADNRDEKAMLERVNALAEQIKWSGVRGRHAKKAALFMRQWARATKDIEPGTAAAIKATTTIIAGVRPKNSEEW